jgi:DNA polymerase
MTLHLDFETRSEADLRVVGMYRYAQHPSTRVLLLSYQIGDDGPVRRWRPGYPFPQELVDYVASGGTVGAHNGAFERRIWNTVFTRQLKEEYGGA